MTTAKRLNGEYKRLLIDCAILAHNIVQQWKLSIGILESTFDNLPDSRVHDLVEDARFIIENNATVKEFQEHKQKQEIQNGNPVKLKKAEMEELEDKLFVFAVHGFFTV